MIKLKTDSFTWLMPNTVQKLDIYPINPCGLVISHEDMAKLGIIVAGGVQSHFESIETILVHNLSGVPIRLTEGDLIAQIIPMENFKCQETTKKNTQIIKESLNKSKTEQKETKPELKR